MDSATEKKEESTIVDLLKKLTFSSGNKSKPKAHKKSIPHKTSFKKNQQPESLFDEIFKFYKTTLANKGQKQIDNANVLLSQLLSAIEIDPLDEYYDLLSRTYNMLGAAHGGQKDWDLQIDYCNDAITAAKNVQNKNCRFYLQAKALINISLAINKQKKSNFDLAGFEKAAYLLENIHESNHSVYYLLLFAYEQILHVYNQSGHLRNAKTEDIPYKAQDIFPQIQKPDKEMVEIRDVFLEYFPNANFSFNNKRKSGEFFDLPTKKKMKVEEIECPDSPSPSSSPS